MIVAKKALRKGPTNISSERVALNHKRAIAMQNGDEEECERLDEKLAELEEFAIKAMATKINSAALDMRKVNERNRVLNKKECREAEVVEKNWGRKG